MLSISVTWRRSVDLPSFLISKFFSDSSRARNANFNAMMVEKLSKQRQTNQINTEDVTKLLEANLTQEMSFTAEQMKLMESVIKQSIADDRKFNENLSNEVLRSLSSMINEQNGHLLEKTLLLSEMVSLFF